MELFGENHCSILHESTLILYHLSSDLWATWTPMNQTNSTNFTPTARGSSLKQWRNRILRQRTTIQPKPTCDTITRDCSSLGSDNFQCLQMAQTCSWRKSCCSRSLLESPLKASQTHISGWGERNAPQQHFANLLGTKLAETDNPDNPSTFPEPIHMPQRWKKKAVNRIAYIFLENTRASDSTNDMAVLLC